MMRKGRIITLASLLAMPTLANADVWAEREALAAVQKEVASLEVLIYSAKSKSNPDDRMTFNYEALIEDLRAIRNGIDRHLTVPMEPIVPTKVDALQAEYTEKKL